MLTISNAFEMSTATATVLVAGFLPLKPSDTFATRGRRAVVDVVDRYRWWLLLLLLLLFLLGGTPQVYTWPFDVIG
jgi:hypothetical protein